MFFHQDRINAKDQDKDGFDSTRRTRSAQELVAEIQRRLDKASAIQGELADLREDLLMQREKYRSLGKSLHEQRVKAGNAEATLMNTLRVFVNEHSGRLPLPISSAYSEVEAARDKLGSMEEDYLQTERILSGVEWTYTEKESDVYQFELHELFSGIVEGTVTNLDIQPQNQPQPPPLLSHPPQQQFPSTNALQEEYNATKVDLNRLRRQFNQLRLEEARHMDLQNLPKPPKINLVERTIPKTEFENRYFNVLGELMTCEVKAQQLKIQHENMPDRRMSEPIHLPPSTAYLKPSDTVTRAQTDTAVPTLYHDPSILQKIGEWLLDYLKSNAIQRTIYFSILEKFGIMDCENVLWDDCNQKYWTTGSTDQFQIEEQNPPLQRTSEHPGTNETSKFDANIESDKPSPSRSMPVAGVGIIPDSPSEPASASPLAEKNKFSDLLGLAPPIPQPHSGTIPSPVTMPSPAIVLHEEPVHTINNVSEPQGEPSGSMNVGQDSSQGFVASVRPHDCRSLSASPERESDTSGVQTDGDTAQNSQLGWDDLSTFATGSAMGVLWNRCHSAPTCTDSSSGTVHRTVPSNEDIEVSGSNDVESSAGPRQEDLQTAGSRPLQGDQGETHIRPRNNSSALLSVDSGFFSAPRTECGCSTGDHWTSQLRHYPFGGQRRASSMTATLRFRYIPYTSEQHEQDTQLWRSFADI